MNFWPEPKLVNDNLNSAFLSQVQKKGWISIDLPSTFFAHVCCAPRSRSYRFRRKQRQRIVYGQASSPVGAGAKPGAPAV